MAANTYDDNASSLENLASEVFFKDVLMKATPDTIDFIRGIINQQNADAVKHAIRERCVQRCYETFCKHQSVIEEDSFAIINSTLDEHFKSLNVCVPFPAFESFSTLMAIIIHRCPNLEKLKVTFRHSFSETLGLRKNGITKKEQRPHTIPSGSLPCLKILILDFGYSARCRSIDETRDSLLSIVGKLCPILVKLHFGRVCAKKMDILALLIKADMAGILFPKDDSRWIEDSVLKGLRIPSQFVNPLCTSLKELIFERSFGSCRCASPKSVYAFALRHILKLEVAELVVPTIQVVKLLNQVRAVHENGFETAWRKAASTLGLVVESPVSFFSGPLSLKKLERIPIYDPCSLRAVSVLCPSVEEVGFEEGDDSSSSFSNSSEDMTDPRITLLDWSNKKVAVNMMYYDSESVKMISDIFGPTLKKLKFYGCRIDMGYLASTSTKLEHLSLYHTTTINESEAAISWTPKTFLPNLTRFRNNYPFGNCLGPIWGALIEEKSTLVHLSLECCHIGTNAYNPRVEWKQLPELWPQLESLEIMHCTDLTMPMVAELIPRFSKLRRILLPPPLMVQDLALTQKIVADFLGREAPIEIKKSYASQFRENLCPYQSM